MSHKTIFRRIYSFLWQNHTLGQIVLKNTFWLSISQVASRLIRAIIVIYAARLLGVSGYGIFSYALAVVGFASIFYDLGINGILTREATKNSDKKFDYLSNALLIKVIMISLLALLISLVVPYFIHNPGVSMVLRIIVWMFIADGLRDFCFAYIRSFERMELEAIASVIANISMVVIAWFMLTRDPNPHTLAIAYSFGSAVGLVLAIAFIAKFLVNPIPYFSYKLVKQILRSAWPFALTGFFSAFLLYTDSLMLGWMKSSSDVGLYAAAQRPIQLLWALPTILAFSAFPVMSRLSKESNQRFGSFLGQAISASLILALPLTMGSLILGQRIVTFMYGSAYIASTSAFQYLSLSFLTVFPSVIIGYAIFSHDMQKRFIIFNAGGAVINIILNAILIPKYGAPGAAIATIISQIVTQVLTYQNAKRWLWPGIHVHIFKPVLATIITGVIIWSVQRFIPQLYWLILIAAVSYVALLFILRDKTAFKFKQIAIDTRY